MFVMKPLFMMCGVYYYYIIVYYELSNERFQITWSCSPAVSGKFTIFHQDRVNAA